LLRGSIEQRLVQYIAHRAGSAVEEVAQIGAENVGDLVVSVETVLAECGQIRTFGMSQSGLSGGSGSTVATSSAAKAMWPLRSAATSAVSSTVLPRAVLTKALPGLIAAIADASSRLRFHRYQAPS